MKRIGFALFWGLPAFVWQVVFFIVPLGILVSMSFWSVRSFRLTPDMTLANWTFLLKAGFFSNAYVYSLVLATSTTLLVSLIAFPAAYWIAYHATVRMRRAIQFLLIVPFFTNYPVRIYAWQVFITEEGIANTVLRALGFGSAAMMATPGATMLGLLTLTFPIVLLVQSITLSNVDRNLIEGAQNLGCSPGRVLLSVILPLARIGLVMAAAFAFIMSFGDFISPALLGGSKPPTLSTLVSDQVRSGNHWPRASVVAVTMIVTLAVAMAIFSVLGFGRGARRK